MGTQIAAYLDEIARLFGEVGKRDATILELRDEITRAVAQRVERAAFAWVGIGCAL